MSDLLIRRCTVVAALLFTLSACGGGSSEPGASTPPPSSSSLCTAGATYALWTDPEARASKPVGMAVAGCGNGLSNVQWTQTSGPTVNVLAAQAQAVSFEPTASGTYRFDLTFTDRTAVPRTVPVSVTVAAATASPSGSRILARLDHAVRGGNAVSVRAWPTGLAANETVSDITWTQLAGPTVTLDTQSDRARILFTAPTVSADTLLRFRVTMTTSLGTDSDDVAVLVVNGPAPASGATAVWDDPLQPVHAYRRSGPLASVLVNCVYNPQSTYTSTGVTNLCPVSQLPLLGTQNSNGLPSIEDVMNRVVVSHDWMGANFEQFLTTQDTNGDFRRLFNGVTAVVIGSHVRPSFYYVLTGAIYLDADDLWLTPEERDVVNEAPDYRSSFDRDLQYTGIWRYTVNSVRVPTYPAATVRETRTQQSLAYGLGDLLYHELTHANDFIAANVRLSLTPSLGTWDNTVSRLNARSLPSDTLAAQFRLASSDLRGLACVKFWGLTATSGQILFTPTQVGTLFVPDGANDEYNYSVALSNGGCNLTGTSREDIAMLMEEFFMASRQGAPRDVAFTNKFSTGLTGNDLFVAWGQRGRIGETTVRPRVRAMLPLIAPWLSTALVDALPAPTPLRVGASWTANLTPGVPRLNPASAVASVEGKPAASVADEHRSLMRQLSGPRRSGFAELAVGESAMAGVNGGVGASGASGASGTSGANGAIGAPGKAAGAGNTALAVVPRNTPLMARRLGVVHP